MHLNVARISLVFQLQGVPPRAPGGEISIEAQLRADTVPSISQNDGQRRSQGLDRERGVSNGRIDQAIDRGTAGAKGQRHDLARSRCLPHKKRWSEVSRRCRRQPPKGVRRDAGRWSSAAAPRRKRGARNESPPPRKASAGANRRPRLISTSRLLSFFASARKDKAPNPGSLEQASRRLSGALFFDKIGRVAAHQTCRTSVFRLRVPAGGAYRSGYRKRRQSGW